MCNRYSLRAGQAAIKVRTRFERDFAGNMPPMTGIFPDYPAPVVHNSTEGRTLSMARWGLPSPAFALQGRTSDSGITNVRNVKSSHWRRWLGVEDRCLVPFTSFSENETLPDGSKPPLWFAFDDSRPLAFFAGIWVPQWKSVRKVKEGETTNDLFAFLTGEASADVKPIHPQAMPAILTTKEEWDTWLQGNESEAMRLQRPLRDGMLNIVARGGKQDGE